tara:strand:+ start:83 stop:211 length:129 start_codon:yes stop_codon:yes gene_type:complete
VKELFRDLIVGIAFKSNGLQTSILATGEAKIKSRFKKIKGVN